MRIIIDTDAGVDDAQAIMMALAHPGAQVEAITTVTGNVHVDLVNRNVLSILNLMRARVPVYSGADRPLLADWQAEIPDVHGTDGLGDWPRRPPSDGRIEHEHAVVRLLQLVNESPGEYTLVALGPLTNIALAARLDPSFPSKIRQFVFMGGTIAARGNTDTVTAEWNIYCDPEAAAIVLTAFEKAVMLSWETTLAHPIAWDDFDLLAAMGTPASDFFGATSAVTAAYQRGTGSPGFLIPDPLAMALTLRPELILESRPYFVSVELHGTQTRGQTVVDYRGRRGRPANVDVVTRMEMRGVLDLYRAMLAKP